MTENRTQKVRTQRFYEGMCIATGHHCIPSECNPSGGWKNCPHKGMWITMDVWLEEFLTAQQWRELAVEHGGLE